MGEEVRHPDAVQAASKLYVPIKAYQTRVIRLHNDNHDPGLPLECDLLIADRLTPPFHLGIRGINGNADYEVTYDALSYTWGDGPPTRSVKCNGVDFPIRENLFWALRRFRHSEGPERWLWVDAICINQIDDQEKSSQVASMLQIFERATTLLCWLDIVADEGLEYFVAVADSIHTAELDGRRLTSEDKIDVWKIQSALSHLYERPWFQRIWIQQEVYAAQRLRFFCGQLELGSEHLRFDPATILSLPRMEPQYEPSQEREKMERQDNLVETNSSSARLRISAKLGGRLADRRGIDQASDRRSNLASRSLEESVQALKLLYRERLGFFQQLQIVKPSLDLIETLLRTAKMKATDTKDHVYAILGMTETPSKPMSIQEWLQTRRKEQFVPIDYNASTACVYATLTWYLLQKCGLQLLLHFKTVNAERDEAREGILPSWAIDWRAAAALLKEHWSLRETARIRDIDSREIEYKGNPWSRLSDFNMRSHNKLLQDNRSNTVPWNTLIVRGLVDPRYYIKDQTVWVKRGVHRDSAQWQPDFKIYPSDVIALINGYAYLPGRTPGFRDPPTLHQQNWGPWLLRPTGEGKYKLLACLEFMEDSRDTYHFYQNWRRTGREKIEKTRDNQEPPLEWFIRPLYGEFGGHEFTSEQLKSLGSYRKFMII